MPKNEFSSEALKHYYRGRVFEAVGELDIAIEEYKKAIEYGADYADIHNFLGKALAKKGFLQEARIEFETALRINPKYLEARQNLNELMLALGSNLNVGTNVSYVREYKETKTYIPTPPPISKQQPSTPPSPPSKPQQYNQPLLPPEEKPSFVPPPPPILTNKVSKKETKLNTYLKISIVGLPIFLILISFLKFYDKIFVKNIEISQKIFITNNETISWISKYKDKLALSSWSTQEIIFYKCLEDSIMAIDVIKLKKDNVVPTAISFHENEFFILDAWNKKIYKYIESNGKFLLVKTIDISEYIPMGITNYKSELLLLDSKNHQIIVFDKNLKKLDSLPLVIKETICISSYKNKVWLLSKDNILYELKNYKEIKNSYKLNFITFKNISSFLVDDKFIWFSSEENNSQIYRYPKIILK